MPASPSRGSNAPRGSARNCPGPGSRAGPDSRCPKRGPARPLGTDWYLEGRAGPIPLTHPFQGDGRTWHSGVAPGGESGDPHLQLLLWARGRRNLPDSSEAPGEGTKPNLRLGGESFAAPRPRRGRGQPQPGRGKPRGRGKGEPGAGCARVGARLGAPRTARAAPGTLRTDGRSGGRGQREKPSEGCPKQVRIANSKLEAARNWNSSPSSVHPLHPRPEAPGRLQAFGFARPPPHPSEVEGPGPGAARLGFLLEARPPARAHEAAAPAAGAGAPLAVPVVMPCPATTREERRAAPPGSGCRAARRRRRAGGARAAA